MRGHLGRADGKFLHNGKLFLPGVLCLGVVGLLGGKVEIVTLVVGLMATYAMDTAELKETTLVTFLLAIGVSGVGLLGVGYRLGRGSGVGQWVV